MSATASDDVDAGGGAGGCVAGGAGADVLPGWDGWDGWGVGGRVVGGGAGSVVVVVVAGAGNGSVSWIWTPRTGDATPGSAGPGDTRSVTVVVVATAEVVVASTNAVVDVGDELGSGVGAELGSGVGADGSLVTRRGRASRTVTSTSWDADGSDPPSY